MKLFGQSFLRLALLGVQLSHAAHGGVVSRQSAHGNRASFLSPATERFLINGTSLPYVPFDIGESYGGVLPVGGGFNGTYSSGNSTEQQLYFWFFPSENPEATDEVLIWLNGGPGCSSLTGLGENGPFVWRAGTWQPVENPWSWSRLTNLVYVDQPVPVGFSEGNVTGTGSAETAQQFLGFWKNFVDTFGLAGAKTYITGVSYAGQYVPYIASAMLDREDSTYFNLQGSMIYDPAINEDVPLVEVPMLAFTEYWQNLLKLNFTFLDYIRSQHAEAGYTSFYEEYFTFPPKGVFPSANNSADFSSRIRGLIEDAMTLQEPCFNVYHITDTCPTLWSWNTEDAFPLPPFTQAGIQDPQLNPGDRGPYYNLTVVRDAIHAPVGREWEACSPNPVFTNPANATSGDGSPRAQLTVMPGVFDRTPGISIVANGQFDMLIPSNGTLFSLQNVTWRGAQGFSEYPPNTLQIPHSGINASDKNGPWSSFAKIEGAGRSGEMGKWVFERGVGFVDVAYAGHGVGRYNAAAMFRIIEVLLERVGVEDGFGGAAWSLDIAAPRL